ncbi:muconolactone Delta-isomerase [Candidatus Hydrogenedentota bacterium]
MLYCIKAELNGPLDMAPEELGALIEKERTYVKEQQEAGKIKFIAYMAARKGSVIIADVADHGELHVLMMGLPMYMMLATQVTPLIEY